MISIRSRTWRKCTAAHRLRMQTGCLGYEKIGEEIDGWRARSESGVLTCSALKRSYRDISIGDRPDVMLVYLKGSHGHSGQRMATRHEHFMPVALLGSQFATLQEPTPDEHPIMVGVGGRPGRDCRRDRASTGKIPTR